VLETYVGTAGLSEGLLVYHDMEGVCLWCPRAPGRGARGHGLRLLSSQEPHAQASLSVVKQQEGLCRAGHGRSRGRV